MIKIQERFFPRIWDGEKYWYPCFSELGITYETDDLPFTEENIKTLDWALGWHFPQSGKDLEFDHEVEGCTGLNDKNGKLIYEGDIFKAIVINSFPGDKCLNKTIIGQVSYYAKECAFAFSAYQPINLFKIEIIGNIHEDAELL